MQGHDSRRQGSLGAILGAPTLSAQWRKAVQTEPTGCQRAQLAERQGRAGWVGAGWSDYKTYKQVKGSDSRCVEWTSTGCSPLKEELG